MPVRSCVPAPDRTDQLCEMRIDLAFVVRSRAQRRAVVEIGPAIPFAVPAVLLDVAAQSAGFDACIGPPARRRRAAVPESANCVST